MKGLIRNPLFYLSLVLAGALVFQMYSIVAAQGTYTAPPGPPPAGNPAQPLDTSGTQQGKTGNLRLGGNTDGTSWKLGVSGNFIQRDGSVKLAADNSGVVTIGEPGTPPLGTRLNVAGIVHANGLSSAGAITISGYIRGGGTLRLRASDFLVVDGSDNRAFWDGQRWVGHGETTQMNCGGRVVFARVNNGVVEVKIDDVKDPSFSPWDSGFISEEGRAYFTMSPPLFKDDGGTTEDSRDDKYYPGPWRRGQLVFIDYDSTIRVRECYASFP